MFRKHVEIDAVRSARYCHSRQVGAAQHIIDNHRRIRDLETAANPAQCDRVAQKAGQAMEEGIMGLMQALRGENWTQANTVLIELDGLETILGDVRLRRAELAAPRK